MARSGVYKSDVQRARDRLRATGTHPSVDAVRVALGNTGSKTTIHRYLRELEEEDGQRPGAKVAISDALQDLVSRLAERLHTEADTVVAQAQARFQAQLQERTQALEQARHEADSLRTHLQRCETALQAECEAGDAARSEVASSTTELAQLEERIAGLTVRVAEYDAHAKSLEHKHEHAREALEHYRTSVKDQREQEQRRHAHQVQELQVALRQTNEALTAKNHDLMQLNRDNGQWLERQTRLERELAQARQRADAQQRERDALRLTAAEYQALQGGRRARRTGCGADRAGRRAPAPGTRRGGHLACHGTSEHVGTTAGAAAATALRWRTRKRHRSRCNAGRQMISRLAKARESSASVPSLSQPGFRCQGVALGP